MRVAEGIRANAQFDCYGRVLGAMAGAGRADEAAARAARQATPLARAQALLETAEGAARRGAAHGRSTQK